MTPVEKEKAPVSTQEFPVGQRVVDIFNVQDPDKILSDRRSLNAKKYRRLKETVDEIHEKGSEVYGYFSAHKGFVLSVIGAAAFASGVIGIGLRMRRKGEKKK